MTLKDIKERCNKLDIPYSFGSFKYKVNPPHLMGTISDYNEFGADNITYYKTNNFRLELTTINKSVKLENKIEREVLYDIYYTKNENEIESEAIYNVTYSFLIEEE